MTFLGVVKMISLSALPRCGRCLVVVAGAAALSGLLTLGQAHADAKAMTCKLSSEKIVGGREKQCLYVCEDKSLEGRIRAASSSCPRTIQSSTR